MKNNSQEYKKELMEVISKISKDKGLLADFIKDILTPRELDRLGVRWQIVKRIAKREHHQSIAEGLHIGVGTVTRGSREMRKVDSALKKALKISGK